MEHVIHEERRLSFFEKYLTGWVILCIGLGIILGKLFPQVAVTLDQISIYQVSIPIAICLFFMRFVAIQIEQMHKRLGIFCRYFALSLFLDFE